MMISNQPKETEDETALAYDDILIWYVEGDHFVFNITISKNIENYYDKIDPELLLEALKQTMTGYIRLEFDEYHLFLE